MPVELLPVGEGRYILAQCKYQVRERWWLQRHRVLILITVMVSQQINYSMLISSLIRTVRYLFGGSTIRPEAR